MKDSNKLVLSFILTLISSTAFANNYKTSIEYRHQFVDGSSKHADRIKGFLDTGKNIGFELDLRFSNNEGSFDKMSSNGSEFTAFYYDKLTDNITGITGLSIDLSDAGLVYVPFVRVNYAFDNGFRLQGRYKWRIWDYNQMNTQINEAYISTIQQLDGWVGYKWGNIDLQYELQFWKEMERDAKPQANNKDVDYQQNFRLMYSYNTEVGTTWRPFIEIGDIKENIYTDERQLRYRIGITYTW